MSLLGKIENFTRKFLFWTPFYSRRPGIVTSEPPEVYNADGEKLHVFFLSDREFAHGPYGKTNNRYILWDRYNYGLRTHFYSHYEAFNLVGKPDKRFAMLNESRGVARACYRKYLSERKYFENEFDYVFTFDSDVLESLSNARFMPFCAGLWVSPENCSEGKGKNISILSSDKNSAKLHRVRKSIAFRCKREGLADTFGTFDGGGFVAPELTLRDYRFSIVIENDITPYFFTEKITNCFAMQTIPVYLGASRINEFFNTDGIITISLSDVDSIEKVLAQCTPEEYARRLPAVMDNYARVKEFANIFDYMWLKHLRVLYQ